MGAIIWRANLSELRPYHVRASGNWMGAYPTRRRAIRHARRLLRNGWASVIVEDVRATATAEKPTSGDVVHNHGPREGRGLDCGERLIGGKLRGWCLDQDATHD